MKDSTTITPLRNKIRFAGIIMIWILLWHLLSLAIHNDIFLPGPVSVFTTLAKIGKTLDFWLAIGHSLWKIGFGFLLGFLLAILLGGLSCRFRFLRDFLAPVISLIKSIPVASFIILVLVWVSSKQLSIFISFLVTFPILYIAVLEGYDHVNQELLEMTKVYQVNPVTKLRYLYVSEILPFLVSGAKVAVGMCWKAGISGEIIGIPKYSIGEQLYLSKLYLDISQMFAWTFVIVFLCFLFEKFFFILLKKIEHLLLS